MGCLSEDVWRSDRVTGSLIPQVIGPFIACDSTPAALHSAGETLESSKRKKERKIEREKRELVGEAWKKINLNSRFGSI